MTVPLGIDINGLAPEHQRRIREIGLDKWMDEQCAQTTSSKVKVSSTPKPTVSAIRINTPHRTWRNCVQCRKSFLAKRKDARLCSTKCRIRSVRYGHNNGLGETDN
jgi:hypothetical protein